MMGGGDGEYNPRQPTQITGVTLTVGGVTHDLPMGKPIPNEALSQMHSPLRRAVTNLWGALNGLSGRAAL
jgi:hypothetical protein